MKKLVKHCAFFCLFMGMTFSLSAQVKINSTGTNTLISTSPSNITGVFIGLNAGANNAATAVYNTFLGNQAGFTNSTGGLNNFIGTQAGFFNNTGGGNNFIGFQTGYKNVSGSGNTFVGNSSGYSNISGVGNSFFGGFSGYFNTGNENSFFGQQAGYNNTSGVENTFIGKTTGLNNSTGSFNTFLGKDVGYSNTMGQYNTYLGYKTGERNLSGNYNNFMGAFSGRNTLGSHNNFIGYQAGLFNTEGSYNNFIGTDAGKNIILGSFNNYLGYQAGMTTGNGSYNLALGHNADFITPGLNNAIAIGKNAKVASSNSMVLGGTGVDAINVGIGVTSPLAQLHTTGSVNFQGLTQNNALTQVVVRDATGNLAWRDASTIGGGGTGSGWALSGNAAIVGDFLGTTNATPLQFKVNNQPAGYVGVTNDNVSYGYKAGMNITGYSNTAIGDKAMLQTGSGKKNTAIGTGALSSNTIGDNNTAIGFSAGASTDGSFNTTIGSSAFAMHPSSNCITLIGANTRAIYNNSNINPLTNATAIGCNAQVNVDNGFVLGDISTVKVGIGTAAPNQMLHIVTDPANNRHIKFDNIQTGIGDNLVIDVNGIVRKNNQISPSNAWALRGNAASASDFLGTTNATPLAFKVNNQPAGYINYYIPNTFFGALAGSGTTGDQNSFFGYSSGSNNTLGAYNSFFGANAGLLNVNGDLNSFFGVAAGRSNTSGSINSFFGLNSGLRNTTGSSNTFIGTQSGRRNTTGSANTALGIDAGDFNTIGSFNTYLGHAASCLNNNLEYSTAIGANAKVSVSNGLVLGQNASVLVGIGTSTPDQMLHIVNDPANNRLIKFENLPTGTGNVLVVDANGIIRKSAQIAFTANNPTNLIQNQVIEEQKNLIQIQQSQIEDLQNQINEIKALLGKGTTGSVKQKDFKLEQNNPNPFSDRTFISYELPENLGNAQILITDMSGKQIKTIPLKNCCGEIEISAQDLPQGIVMYSLVAKGQILKTNKMVVAKN